MSRSEIEKNIESAYSLDNWRLLLYGIFESRFNAFAKPDPIELSDEKQKIAKSAVHIGDITLNDGTEIAVYDITLSDSVELSRNRVAIRNLLKTHWNQYDGAFIASHKDDKHDWRFTFVSEIKDFDEEGKYKSIKTEPKRYTYVLGGDVSHRTASDRFSALSENTSISIADIKQAFSVEALTKEFYKELFKWYEWTLDEKTGIRFPYNVRMQARVETREPLDTKIIRLITRLMFVWFIKQKKLVPDKIFDTSFLKSILKDFDPYSMTSGNYYNAILQNLFFATLNKAIVDKEDGSVRRFSEKKVTNNGNSDLTSLYRYAELFSFNGAESIEQVKERVIELFADVPFLNGGLFECLDKDGTQDETKIALYDDGFSKRDDKVDKYRYKYRAFIPNAVFFDEQKGLIPLLNKYNFTVEENTPNEQQVALDPELLGKVFENLLGVYNPETQETARKESGSFYTPREIVNFMVDESLLAYLGKTDTVKSLFSEDFVKEERKDAEYKAIATKLREIKILDPACGSGAFPMGLLNRIVDILQKIEPTTHIFDLKRDIIEKCIYGSDIQPIAIQISKLRFFISLICDCEKSGDKENNYNIPTLPNLETKFVAANSLIAIKKREEQHNLFEDPEVDITKDKLQQIRHEHFSASTAGAKNRLRNEDKICRTKLLQLLEANKDYKPEDAQQLAEWNPYNQNKAADFFDPEWMFGLKDGFDIVIGNPPYIQLQNNSGELAKLYENCGYETFARTGDIYCLFYERGQQLLKENAHLCYITSNKWMRAGYGEKTRKFFATKTNPELLIDFAGVKIFESATVDTNILLFSKAKNKGNTICAVTNKQNKDSINNLSVFVEQSGNECAFNNSDSWVILSPIEMSIKKKIEAVGTPLKDWDIQINYGIKTGYNDAFIITTEKRDEILSNCKTADDRKRTEELIRPILRGRDIKRYSYDWAGLWLINTHNGVRGKIPRINIDEYPAIKAHLDNYWDKIVDRADQGDTPYNLRNCAYMDLFYKPKICWKAVGRNLAFAIVEAGTFLTAPASFISAGNFNDYILAYLCSSMAKYYIYKNSDTTGAGDIMLNIQSLIMLPIPVPQEPVVFSSTTQEHIDDIVFKSYGFSDEEIEYIKMHV